ncbi:TetR/AcrR family transcriptional regulator [Gordonia phthalatica]|uniref:Transcriptional regulator n=1 Tax=Gordonia phthalatica TaxID=1136941 RepID=A0A0N9NHB4_9ACTN|nr:TetR/AcrR family transcriptional regulator [Gordonia phthalatica]ALG86557.1 transcriptional regulator [Gordonia phthalatica]
MSRKQQRERTHQVLLDATMRCLVEFGHSGTTTQRIQEEAGVSRGALLHHFGSKTELLVAAIHHIADVRMADVDGMIAGLGDGPDALRDMVTALREAMTGPPFQAALELWTASRTDPQLREALLPAERRLGEKIRTVFNEHSGISDPKDSVLAFESLMALIRGFEITRNMRPDQRVADLVIDDWLARTTALRD